MVSPWFETKVECIYNFFKHFKLRVTVSVINEKFQKIICIWVSFFLLKKFTSQQMFLKILKIFRKIGFPKKFWMPLLLKQATTSSLLDFFSFSEYLEFLLLILNIITFLSNSFLRDHTVFLSKAISLSVRLVFVK